MPPQVAPTPGARVSWAATASPALKAEPEIKVEPDAQGAPPGTLAELRAGATLSRRCGWRTLVTSATGPPRREAAVMPRPRSAPEAVKRPKSTRQKFYRANSPQDEQIEVRTRFYKAVAAAIQTYGVGNLKWETTWRDLIPGQDEAHESMKQFLLFYGPLMRPARPVNTMVFFFLRWEQPRRPWAPPQALHHRSSPSSWMRERRPRGTSEESRSGSSTDSTRVCTMYNERVTTVRANEERTC